MVGNDVVDINFASKQSNWQCPGFLKKVFTEQEQDYILNSDNPDLTVWLLWSMKESAYKVYVQQFRKRFFAPLKFECLYEPTSEFKGKVNFNSCSYITSSEIINKKIYTIAYPDGFTHPSPSREGKFGNRANIIYEKIVFPDSLYSTQHKTIYSSVLRKISWFAALSPDKLTIKKDPLGIPKILYNEQTVNLSLSLSHHGLYGAYVLSTE